MTVTPRQNQTITFNAFATKTYGNADFAVGATSSNGSIPVTYTSSNPAVATIVGNNIHIVSAGTSTITASQAGNTLYFPAPDVARVLTVNKANLTVKAVDTTKLFGEVNPTLRLIYTGFVLNETITNLSTQPTATTTATTNLSAWLLPDHSWWRSSGQLQFCLHGCKAYDPAGIGNRPIACTGIPEQQHDADG
jgi:uncharacterized protein YjdB